jgi:hypothetical protein
VENDKPLYAKPLVLPHGQNLALFELKDRELHHVSPLPFSSFTEFAVGAEGWLAAIVERRSVKCWNTRTNAELIPPIPRKFFARVIAFAGQILYIGGDTADALPFLGFCDLGAESPQWKNIEVPDEVVSQHKSVDGLLVDGSRLIALDNVVVPNWLLAYDISNPLQPSVSNIEKLVTHGTWERIEDASVGSRWIAVSSVTGSRGGPGQYIAILDKNTFQEQAIISTQPIPTEKSQQPWPGPSDWSEITFLNDRLYVAAGEDGLGILDLSEVETVDTETCRSMFHFIPPSNLFGGKILRVIPGVSANSLGIVLETKDNLESVTMGSNFQSAIFSDVSNRFQSAIVSWERLLNIQRDSESTPFEKIDRRNRQYWKSARY